MVLAECGIKYEDIRIPSESWPSIKNDYIFTQVLFKFVLRASNSRKTELFLLLKNESVLHRYVFLIIIMTV